MTKITYNKLELNNVNIDDNIIVLDNKQEVSIKAYLPIQDKINLIDMVVQESIVEGTGYVDPILSDIIFHTYIVIFYSNVAFTDSQKQNIFKLYDQMERSGFITKVVQAIPNDEYDHLVTSLEKRIEKVDRDLASVVRLIQEGMEQLKATFSDAEGSLETVNLNSETLQNVLAIAKDNGVI